MQRYSHALLGIAAIRAGCRVRFTSAVGLGQELLLAQAGARLPKALKAWDRFDLVIVDELGYLALGPGAPLLFQFCTHRYERASMRITTDLELSVGRGLERRHGDRGVARSAHALVPWAPVQRRVVPV